MNKQLSPSEISPFVPVLSKRDKLLRLAHVIRFAKTPVFVFNGLEYLQAGQWEHLSHPHSAFALAVQDPILRDAGMTSDTVGAAKRFFGLSKADLHEFSCDCGGTISNEEMARRVERIAY
jgi:hypothetical protein